MAKTIRTRIAPSPTGNLHVGTARAALFNELFARRHGGQFIVRIEDTDPARSTHAFEENILEGLLWLGLTWDEGPDKGGAFGPYRQSERSTHYVQAIQKLLDAGAAYTAPDSQAIILKVPADAVGFTDLIRGTVTVTPESWGGDFVIARGPADPLFHLAVVVDDAAQEITHVIRGEDHLSNTARHILLQRALGLPTPEYAHLPLLLGTDRRKLSKRSDEVSLLAYRDQGYLPDALLTYLALLGWNPKTDQEFFTHEELIAAFSLENVQKGGAIFDEAKLKAVNKYYLQQLSPDAFLESARPFLEAADVTLEDRGYWQAAAACEQARVSTLQELPEALEFFKPDWSGEYSAELLVWKKSTPDAAAERLKATGEFLATLSPDDFSAPVLEEKLLAWIDAHDLGRGDTLWPLRVALTGREHSPGPFEVAAVLGPKTTRKRIDAAFAKLKA
jgi:glutamyl-tRNA synthetase